MSGAPAKRQAVRELIAAGLSQTKACTALATSRSSLAYVPRARDDEALVAAIKPIHKRKPRWGYKRVHAQLRREGHQVNRTRVHALVAPARRALVDRLDGGHQSLVIACPRHVGQRGARRGKGGAGLGL